jgi:DNA/RNA endonuclease YhcR with UshA esterase domain
VKPDTLRGKTIRAKGTVSRYNGAPQVQIYDAANLEVLSK